MSQEESQGNHQSVLISKCDHVMISDNISLFHIAATCDWMVNVHSATRPSGWKRFLTCYTLRRQKSCCSETHVIQWRILLRKHLDSSTWFRWVGFIFHFVLHHLPSFLPSSIHSVFHFTLFSNNWTIKFAWVDPPQNYFPFLWSRWCLGWSQSATHSFLNQKRSLEWFHA